MPCLLAEVLYFGDEMLEEAHKGLEAMSIAAKAVKDEQWGEAERALMELQEITGLLLREVGDKARKNAGARAGYPGSRLADPRPP